MPIEDRMTSMSVLMSLPLMKAVPDVGGNSPVRMDLENNKILYYIILYEPDSRLVNSVVVTYMVVVFPAPL